MQSSNDQDFDTFEATSAPDAGEALIVDLVGFEGPLDLLLALARTRKVDLSVLSILDLADQYLSFVAEAKHLRIEVAADYLVMAAWLAYLKSRLLLPKPAKDEGPSGEELASELATRLQRLDLMRRAGQALMARPLLGRDVFARGAPETPVHEVKPVFEATLYDLLSAYGARRRKMTEVAHSVEHRVVWSLDEARAALERLIGRSLDWLPMDLFLANFVLDVPTRRSARASTFAASLDLAREGKLDLRQDKAFSPILVRHRAGLGLVG